MCGIWGGDSCTAADSCNVFGHDYVNGDCVHCVHCGHEEGGTQ